MRGLNRAFALLCALWLAVAVPAAEIKTEAAKKPVPAKPALERTHWLTIKSGIRHNSKCRYFQNSKGRPSTKEEGSACKKCGG